MGFLGMVLELYSCISLTQTIISYNKGATSLNILGHDHRVLINGLTYTAVACHFVVFFSLFMALKFSFLVNWYFTYQDKVSFFTTCGSLIFFNRILTIRSIQIPLAVLFSYK